MTRITSRLRLWWRSVITVCCVFAAPLSMANPGIDWLVSQQQADGSFTHSPASLATPFQATAEVVLTLQAMELTGNPAYRPAVDYIAANTDNNTEYLAKKIRILAADGQDVAALVAELVSRQNPDGGFGDQPGYGSSVLDTALSLLVLDKIGSRQSVNAESAVNYLLSVQDPDGSFNAQSGDMASAFRMSVALTGLQPYMLTQGIGQQVFAAREYLFSLQSGGSWITPWEDAAALLGVVPNTTDTSRYQGAIDALNITQDAQGSWLQDVYSTALALRALHLAATVTTPVDPGKGTIRGHLIDATSKLGIGGVTVTIDELPGVTITSIPNGEFEFTAIDPGTYTLRFTHPGYFEAFTGATTGPSEVNDLGDIELGMVPTAGIVNGFITDAVSGLPVAGATVSITGVTPVTTTTTANGFYSLVTQAGSTAYSVSATGYETLSGGLTIIAGGTITVSPVLYPLGEPVPGSVSISGTVVDESTQSPLIGVLVSIQGTALTAITDASGNFIIDNVSIGAFTLQLDKTGYATRLYSMAAVGSGRYHVGTLTMSTGTAESTSTVYGRVLDLATGQPIQGATVTVDITGQGAFGSGTTTDADGNYRIEGIAATQFVVSATAIGYVGNYRNISLAQHDITNIDLQLQSAALSGFDITSFTTDKTSYPPLSKISFAAVLSNSSTTPISARLYVALHNEAGEVLEYFPISRDNTQNTVTVVAGGEATKNFEWDSGRHPGGSYSYVLQAINVSNNQLLAEKAAFVTIESVKKLGGSVEFDPPISQLASNKPVAIKARLTNGGNEPIFAGTVTASVYVKNAGYAGPVGNLKMTSILEGDPLNRPTAFERDTDGSFVVANQNTNMLIRIAPDGTATDITPTSSRVKDIDLAPDGTIYFLDTYLNRISPDGTNTKIHYVGSGVGAVEVLPNGRVLFLTAYRIDELLPDGTVVQLIGRGLVTPYDMVSDASGNLYIADDTGSIVLFDGNGLSEYVGGLAKPRGLAIDIDGSLLVTSYSGNSLLRIAADKTISTVATGLSGPYDVALDANNNYLVSNHTNHEVVTILRDGTVTNTYTNVISDPTAAAYDTQGNLYFLNAGAGGGLAKVDTSGVRSIIGPVSTNPRDLYVDATGTAYFLEYINRLSSIAPDGTKALINGSLSSPAGMVPAPDGNGFLIGQNSQSNIVRVDTAGVTSVYADRLINTPKSMRSDPSGNVLILNNEGFLSQIANNETVSRIAEGLGNNLFSFAIDLDGSYLVSSFTTRQILRVAVDGSSSVLADLTFSPDQVVVDSAGNIFFTQYGGTVIYSIDTAGVVTPAANLSFRTYHEMVADSHDAIWVTHATSSRVSKKAADGTITVYQVSSPNSLLTDSAGGVYVGSVGSISHIDATGAISTVYLGPELSGKTIVGMSYDASGRILVLTKQGEIFRYLPGFVPEKSFASIKSPTGLALTEVGGLLVVGQNNKILHLSAANALPEVVGSGTFEKISHAGGNTYYLSASTAVKKFDLSTGIISDFATGLSKAGAVALSAAGDVIVPDRFDNSLSFYTSTGVQSDKASGVINPRGVLIDSLNNTLVAIQSGGIYRIRQDGWAEKFATIQYGANYMSLEPDGSIVVTKSNSGDISIVNSSGNVVETFRSDSGRANSGILRSNDDSLLILSTNGELYTRNTDGSFDVLASGIGVATDLESSRDNRIYLTDRDRGTVNELVNNNTLSLIADGFINTENLVIADSGTIYVSYNNYYLAGISPDGNLTNYATREIFQSGGIDGLAIDMSDVVYVISDFQNFMFSIDMTPPAPPSIGDMVYQASVSISDLATDGMVQNIDFGNWIPEIAGDYEVKLSFEAVDTSSVINTLHVGPLTDASFTLSNNQALLGDQALSASVAIMGLDSTSVAKLLTDSGIVAADSNIRAVGMVADSTGNIYGHNSIDKLYKITPDGTRTDLVTGIRFGSGSFPGFGFQLAIDKNDLIYGAVGRDVVTVTPEGVTNVLVTMPGRIGGLAMNQQDELIVSDMQNSGVYKVGRDGSITLLAKAGVPYAYAVTVDAYDNIFVANPSWHTVVKIDTNNHSEIIMRDTRFEYEGVNLAGDCSSNLLFAPMIEPNLKPFGSGDIEEHKILQWVGNTGEVRLVLDGPTVDPALRDMDVLVYDKKGNRVLIWTDLNTGKIFSFPIKCGSLDVKFHMVTRSDVDFASADPAPASIIDNGDGTFEYIWHFPDADSVGENIALNMLAKGLTEGETRPLVKNAFLSFANSFAQGEEVSVPVDIPNLFASAGVSMSTAISGTAFGPNTDVVIDTTVTNDGLNPFDGEVRARIVDASGVLVELLPPLTVTGVLPSTNQLVSTTWNTGTIINGDYQAVVSLWTAAGEMISEQSVGFTIEGAVTGDPAAAVVVLQTTTDKQQYNTYDQVVVESIVQNKSANAIISGATLQVVVGNALGQTVYDQTIPFGADLVPGAIHTMPMAVQLSGVAESAYTATGIVRDGQGNVLSTSNATFTVAVDLAKNLSGSVTVAQTPITVGDAQSCTYTLNNLSNSNVTGLSVTELVVDIAGSTTVSTFPVTTDIAAGGTYTSTRDITTASLPEGDYACVVQANVNGVDTTFGNKAFELRATAYAAATASTDQALYHYTDNAQLSALISNPTARTTLSGMAVFTVTDAQGNVLFTTTSMVGLVLAGEQITVAVPYAFSQLAEGSYTLTVEVQSGAGAVLAAHSTVFAVQDRTLDFLSATEQVALPEVGNGEIQTCTATLNNAAQFDMPGLNISHALTDANGLLIDEVPATVDLLAGSQQSLVRTINTTSLAEGGYRCEVAVTYQGQRHVLAGSNFTVILPIKLEGTLGLGDKGRVLVWLDNPQVQCDGVKRFDLMSSFATPLTSSAVIDVMLIGKDGMERDRESISLASALLPVNLQPGVGADLSIIAADASQLQLSIAANDGVLEPAMEVVAQVYDGVTLHIASGVVDTSCALAVNGTHGGYSVSAIEASYVTADGEPYGPATAPTLAEQRAFIEIALSNAGWAWTIVEDSNSFSREFLSGGYQVYALFAESSKLKEGMHGALREAVFRGEGLLLAGPHDHRNLHASELVAALGVKANGRWPAVSQAELVPDALLTGTGVLNILDGDTAMRARPGESATVLANYVGVDAANDCSGSNNPNCVTAAAITLNTYGQGRAAWIGFDLLAAATQAGNSSTEALALLEALNKVHPASLDTAVRHVVPVKATVTNIGIDTTARLSLPLPADTVLMASQPATDAEGVMQWTFPIAADESKDFILWLQLPATAGPLTLNGQVTAPVEGSSPGDVRAELSLTLDVLPAQDLATVITTLESLVSSDKPTAAKLKNAVKDLQLAAAAWPARANKAYLYGLKAADRLAAIEDAVAGLDLSRAMLGDWLWVVGRDVTLPLIDGGEE